ncbi:MAG TPA: GerMN domain-containing protein [Pyrinomonadaceae bacterium]|nr:GerMN domain-containing protein [Pyrinomonadaceae bacterium]
MRLRRVLVSALLAMFACGFYARGADARQIKLFFIAVEDNGQSGKKIGCNDSVVPVDVNVARSASPLKTAYERLLAVRADTYSPRKLSNALSKSRLKVRSVAIRNRTAVVRLTGRLVSAGVCEDPRIEAQLKETALQFPAVERVSVFVNGVALSRLLSGR